MLRTNDGVIVLSYLKRKRVAINGDFSFFWKKPFFRRELPLIGRINPHIAITGQSGSGKSNATSIIIKELADMGYNFIILDPKNDYVGIAEYTNARIFNARYDGINVFERGNASVIEKVSELSNIFQKNLRLGHVQRNLLYRCLKYTYEICERKRKEPNFSGLIFTMNVFKKNAEIKGNKAEKTMLEYLINRFSSLEYLESKNIIKISEAIKSRSIFVLGELGTADAQSIFMEGILRQIYSYAISSSSNDKFRVYIVVDEAGKLGDNPILGRLVSEGRKFGVGIIAVSQSAKSLDKDIRCNSSLFISFYTREPEELSYVSNLISGGSDGERSSRIKGAFRSLKLGEAVALDCSNNEPVILKFGISKILKPPLRYTVEEMSRGMIKKDELINILVKRGFIRLEIEVMIERLYKEGILIEYTFNANSKYDGSWYSLKVKNTPEHDISIYILSLHLKNLGFYSKIYNKAYGPDIIAELDDIKYAMEYETGIKDIEETKKMILNRSKSYGRIIILCKKENLKLYKDIKNAKCISIEEFLSFQDKKELFKKVVFE